VNKLAPNLFTDCTVQDFDIACARLRERIISKSLNAISLVGVGPHEAAEELLVFTHGGDLSFFLVEGALHHAATRLHAIQLSAEQEGEDILDRMHIPLGGGH
jgi:hypothetical protein